MRRREQARVEYYCSVAPRMILNLERLSGGCGISATWLLIYRDAEGRPECLPKLAAALARESADLLLALGGSGASCR